MLHRFFKHLFNHLILPVRLFIILSLYWNISFASHLAITQYNKVRFIGYAVPTTVSGLIPIGNVNGKGSVAGYFTGDSNLYQDMQARADILIHAIETANQRIQQHENNDVINVFVAPEFYFHGIYGPYLWNPDIQVDPINFLEDYLKYHLKDYHNWIFVCGTMVTLKTTDTLGDIFNQYNAQNAKAESTYGQYILNMLSGAYENATKSATALQNFIERYHLSTNLPIQNRAIVIDNINTSPFALSVQKRYISNEDLPVETTNDNYHVISEQISNYPEINLLHGDLKQSPNDPYSIFSIQFKASDTQDKGISNLAVETCLDHGNNRLRTNFKLNQHALQLREGGNSANIHIQLIPSAGMQIHANGVVADKNGFVFNVDGEYALTNTTGVDSLYLNYNGNEVALPFSSPDYPNGKYAYGAHSQLAEVSQTAKGDIPGIDNAEFISTQTLQSKIDTTVINLPYISNFTHYYGGGEGAIHIYGLNKPMALY